MKFFFTFILTLVSLSVFSQTFIGLNKNRTKKALERYVNSNNWTSPVQETDSTVYLLLRDTTKVQRADFVFSFNEAGKCYRETRVLSCDSCLTKFVKGTVAIRGYNFQKLNDTTYVSQYSNRLLLLMDRNTSSFTITRMDWDRQAYRQFIRDHTGK
jgi:hypothetical protein